MRSKKKQSLFLGVYVIICVGMYLYWTGKKSTMKNRHLTINDRHSTIKDQHSTIKDRHSTMNDRNLTITDRELPIKDRLFSKLLNLELVKSQSQTPEATTVKEKHTRGKYAEFQRLNDNMTYVYAGYYDDREEEAEVKVIAMIPKKIRYNFTCTVYYTEQSMVQVTGYAKYHFARVAAFTLTRAFQNGYIICPVSKKMGPPKFISLSKRGIMFPKTDVIVWPPSKEKNKVTRCIKPFINNYSDVSQLISNIELFRVFGVDKHIIYMENQTPGVEDVVRSYVNDGLVEIRNFSILQPETPIGQFIKSQIHWAQWSAYHDCILSQMKSAKYVMVFDVDEVLVPRKHKTIWEMADDLFAQTELDPKPAGALMFRNVYFPTFKNRTTRNFKRKGLALKYNIHPLLYTTRLKTSKPYIGPKSLVRPETVEVMFIHYVETFKKGWSNKIVDEDVATMHHYRGSTTGYMFPPETEDDYILQFSEQLISAVEERFKKALL